MSLPQSMPSDEITFVADSGEVRRGDRVAVLTRVEMDIFDGLHSAFPRFCTREALYDDAYGLRSEAEEPEPKVIDVHLVHLRDKLAPLGIAIENKFGFGWRLQISTKLPAFPKRNSKGPRSMKNRLKDLNDHLFMQLERLADEDLTAEQIESEVKRADAIVQVADKIVDNARLHLQAASLVANHGDKMMKHLPMIAGPTGGDDA